MLKVISPQELGKNLDPILDALEETGTTVIIKKHDQPAALLVRFDAYMAMLATMDYSGWERWVEAVRGAFPQASLAAPRRPKSLMPSVIDPADIGYAPKLGQVGSPSGRQRLGEELAGLGIQLQDDELGQVYSLILNLAEKKQVLYPEDLKLAVDEALGRAATAPFSLSDIQIHQQSGVPSTAEVTLQVDGRPTTARATGSGPLDAAFKAVQLATGLDPELEDFSLAAATRGSDALGEAVVTLSQANQVAVGKAVSTDVIEAGVQAYLKALNWLVRTGSDVAGAASARSRG